MTRVVRAAAAGVLCALAFATAPPALAKDSYPPPVSHGQGTAKPSRVGIGECTTFSGGGFQPDSRVVITDDGQFVKRARTDDKGKFSTKVCFNSSAHPGRHELAARGTGKRGEDRTVTADVYVLGSSESRAGGRVALPHTGPGSRGSGEVAGLSGSRLPFTGFRIVLVTVIGLALVVLGSFVLLWTERRYRRLRRRRTKQPQLFWT